MTDKMSALRRAEINARLDQLQELEPTPENIQEFSALCQELQSLPRPSDFRRICYRFRGFIWVGAVMLCLQAFLLGPVFLRSPTDDVVAALMFVSALASIAWAIWSSNCPM